MSTDKQQRTGTGGFLLTVLALLALWAAGTPAAADAAVLSVSQVRTDRMTLQPGEVVGISFLLSADARVSLLIHDPDYTVVRRLLEGERKAAGTVVASWDGKDDAGAAVPDEAYLISIDAEGAAGEHAGYDPLTVSGGEALNDLTVRAEAAPGGYTVRYSVPVPARISLRAGVHRGPLLKNLIEGKAVPPGDHALAWDGLDETGTIEVMKEPASVLVVRGHRLAENAIIVQGREGDYPAYHRSLKAGTGTLSRQRARASAVSRGGAAVASSYLARVSEIGAPRFEVFLGKEEITGLADQGAPVVSDRAELRVEVLPESRAAFTESRYEMIVFIDNERFDEEEQAYPSYTYLLDSRRVANGVHRVTVNLAGIDGQVGAYSFTITVRN